MQACLPLYRQVSAHARAQPLQTEEATHTHTHTERERERERRHGAVVAS